MYADDTNLSASLQSIKSTNPNETVDTLIIVGDPQPQKLNKKSWTWHGLLYFLFYFFLLVWPLRSPDWEVCLAGNIAKKNCGYF